MDLADMVFLGPPLMVVETILFVAAVGLSILASYLMRPEIAGNPSTKKAAPTTLSQRGSFVNYLIGRQRVGPVIGWAGDRVERRERVGGASKGGGGGSSSSSRQSVFFESTWHILAVGPASILHGIWVSGKYQRFSFFSSTNFPSGTSAPGPNGSTMTIFWGEKDQPANTFLGDATRVSITSRWPHYCYIVYTNFRLGTAPRWPIINYDLEVAPLTTYLAHTPTRGSRTASFNGTPVQVITVDSDSAGAVRSNFFEVAGTQSLLDFPPRTAFTYTGDATVGTLNLTVHRSEVLAPNVNSGGLQVTRIYAEQSYVPFTGSAPFGNITPAQVTANDGFNSAHLMAQILFDPYPHGMGFDINLFDLEYLEEVGLVTGSEGIRGVVLGQNGDSALRLLGSLMQDTGMVLSWSVKTGLFIPKIIRDPGASVPTLLDEHVLDPLPEISAVLKEHAVDKLVFVFADKDLNFKDMTISIDEDGQASQLELARARTIRMPTVNDFDSATAVAERRSQEDISGGAAFTVYANREARLLFAGQALVVPGIQPLLRIMEVELTSLSGKVMLECITDFYSAEESTYTRLRTLGGDYFPNPADTPADSGFVDAPVLAHRDSKEDYFHVPYIRRDVGVSKYAIWLSRDDVTYTMISSNNQFSTGGTLTSGMLIDATFEIAQGPTFDILGPDVADVEDYSADDFNFYRGRQLAMIGSEIFFLRGVTALGGSSYRLDGLLRARHGTVRAGHEIGVTVYIFQAQDLRMYSDVLYEADEQVHLKVQPISSILEIPLTAVDKTTFTPKGSGKSPITPVNLTPASWAAGSCLEISWDHFNREYPGTGAGEQGAGASVQPVEPEGTFELRMLTAGDTLKRVVEISRPPFLYDNADLVSDFTSEPTTFKVELRAIYGGRRSDAVTVLLVSTSPA